MSPRPAHRSADLERLRDEGYRVALVDGQLEVSDIPYATVGRTVGRGTLVVPLRMAANRTMPPDSHTVGWRGGRPRTATGAHISGMNAALLGRSGQPTEYWQLCQKPFGREFRDYHELVTSYVNMLGQYAVLLDATCTARTGGGVVKDHNPDSPFHYIDTATGRAGIQVFQRKLEGMNVGIVGLGGTGSYVLDLVAKTPVSTIHLFDDDTFDQHNAFRAPGAASLEEIALQRTKVDHLASIYSRLHRGIVPHGFSLTRGRLAILDRMDFVFLCIDRIAPKRAIIDRLERNGTGFVDTGLGIDVGADGIFGLVRVTTSVDGDREAARGAIPGGAGGRDDPYRSNVQVADLNALNAALAVIRWKRLCGFYRDGGSEHNGVFVVETGSLYSTSSDSRDPGSSS